MPDGHAENEGSDEARVQAHERPEQPSQLRNLNERHAVFYRGQSKRLEEQLTETTFKIAMEQRQSEAYRGIPIERWSFERAIDDAARASAIVKAEQARRAGKSKKTDPLQELIIQIDRENPKITCPQLLEKLKKSVGNGIIDDVDNEGDSEPSIYFKGHHGRAGKAPISGLKDRLTRARKVAAKAIAQTR